MHNLQLNVVPPTPTIRFKSVDKSPANKEIARNILYERLDNENEKHAKVQDNTEVINEVVQANSDAQSDTSELTNHINTNQSSGQTDETDQNLSEAQKNIRDLQNRYTKQIDPNSIVYGPTTKFDKELTPYNRQVIEDFEFELDGYTFSKPEKRLKDYEDYDIDLAKKYIMENKLNDAKRALGLLKTDWTRIDPISGEEDPMIVKPTPTIDEDPDYSYYGSRADGRQERITKVYFNEADKDNFNDPNFKGRIRKMTEPYIRGHQLWRKINTLNPMPIELAIEGMPIEINTRDISTQTKSFLIFEPVPKSVNTANIDQFLLRMTIRQCYRNNIKDGALAYLPVDLLNRFNVKSRQFKTVKVGPLELRLVFAETEIEKLVVKPPYSKNIEY